MALTQSTLQIPIPFSWHKTRAKSVDQAQDKVMSKIQTGELFGPTSLIKPNAQIHKHECHTIAHIILNEYFTHISMWHEFLSYGHHSEMQKVRKLVAIEREMGSRIIVACKEFQFSGLNVRNENNFTAIESKAQLELVKIGGSENDFGMNTLGPDLIDNEQDSHLKQLKFSDSESNNSMEKDTELVQRESFLNQIMSGDFGANNDNIDNSMNEEDDNALELNSSDDIDTVQQQTTFNMKKNNNRNNNDIIDTVNNDTENMAPKSKKDTGNKYFETVN